MNAIVETAFSGAVARRAGWALVHFVWQGAAVALALAVALQILRRASAHARWLAACAALGLMAVLPVATAFFVDGGVAEPGAQAEAPPAYVLALPTAGEPAAAEMADPLGAPEAASSVPALEAPSPSWHERLAASVEPHLPWIVLLWLAGVLALSAWHLGGWWQVARGKRFGTRPVGEAVADTFARLAERLAVSRPVRLLESTRAAVPMVVGWLRPVVLLPASVATGLTADQLQAVLAHELAHVRRWDCLIRIGQVAVETLLFYHPAVWWVSARVRHESEQCCDDLAVEVCGDRHGYARALARVAELGRAPRLATAAAGGKLLPRIRRILGAGDAREGASSGRWLAGILAVGVVAVLAAAPLLRVAAAPAPAEAEAGAVYQATLPDGITVELVGVSYNPSEGRPWWRPDASPLPEAPYERLSANVMSERARELCVRLGGALGERADRVGTRWETVPSASSAGAGPPAGRGGAMQALRGIAVGFPDNADVASVRFGVASGPWQALFESGPKGASSQSRQWGYALFAEPVEVDGAAQIAVTYPKLDQEMRIVALDLSGTVHRAGSSNSNGVGDVIQTTCDFKGLPLDQVKGFQLQARPYQWVEFRNVSLDPGHRTKVEVVVEAALAPETVEVRALVEDFFKHNFRDITARDEVEWGPLQVLPDGNRSVRYKCQATIWGKDKITFDKVFTFSPGGEFVSVQDPDVLAEGVEGQARAFVLDYFAHNWHDITQRRTIEWGKVGHDADGNLTIRYKFEAMVHGKDKVVLDKVFTFTPEGKFVKVSDAPAAGSVGGAEQGPIVLVEMALSQFTAEGKKTLSKPNVQVRDGKTGRVDVATVRDYALGDGTPDEAFPKVGQWTEGLTFEVTPHIQAAAPGKIAVHLKAMLRDKEGVVRGGGLDAMQVPMARSREWEFELLLDEGVPKTVQIVAVEGEEPLFELTVAARTMSHEEAEAMGRAAREVRDLDAGQRDGVAFALATDQEPNGKTAEAMTPQELLDEFAKKREVERQAKKAKAAELVKQAHRALYIENEPQKAHKLATQALLLDPESKEAQDLKSAAGLPVGPDIPQFVPVRLAAMQERLSAAIAKAQVDLDAGRNDEALEQLREARLALEYLTLYTDVSDQHAQVEALMAKVQAGIAPGGSPEAKPGADGRRQGVGRGVATEMPEDRAVREKLKQQVVIQFDMTPLAQVVEFLQQTTGVNFSLRRQDVPMDGAPVTLAMHTTLENALNQITELTGMAWKVDGGLVKIGSPAALAVYEMRIYNVAHLLVSTEDKTPGGTTGPDISALATRAQNLILLIKQACGEGTWTDLFGPVLIDPARGRTAAGPAGAQGAATRGFGVAPGGFGGPGATAAPSGFGPPGVPGAGGPERLQGRAFIMANDPANILVLQTPEVHRCIERLLTELGGTGKPPLRAAAGAPKPAEAMSAEDRAVREKLKQQVSIRFDGTPLAQVIEFLQQTTGVSFALRRQDLPIDGAPVTLAMDATLEVALNTITELTGMAWKVDGGLVKIGSPEALHIYETRVYNVTDLLVSVEDRAPGGAGGAGEPGTSSLTDRAQNLILLIKQACGEDTWADAYGGVITDTGPFGVPGPGPRGRAFLLNNDPHNIIVVQTAEVHRCIEDLLKDLRASAVKPGGPKALDTAALPAGPLPLPDKRAWRAVAEARNPTPPGRPNISPEDQAVREKLEQPVSIRFDATPLAQVVEFLQQTTGVNFSLRRQDLPIDGAPVTLAIDTTLENALNQITELTGMAWKVDGGLVKIGNPAALATYEMRVYNVTDVLGSIEDRPSGAASRGRTRGDAPSQLTWGTGPPAGTDSTSRADNLILLIKQACGEDTWEEADEPAVVDPSGSRRPAAPAPTVPGGGVGFGGPFGEPGAPGGFGVLSAAQPAGPRRPHGRAFVMPDDPNNIVIVQTAEVHKCIEQLLKELRGSMRMQVRLDVFGVVFPRGDTDWLKPDLDSEKLLDGLPSPSVETITANALWQGDLAAMTLPSGGSGVVPDLDVRLRATPSRDMKWVFLEMSSAGEPWPAEMRNTVGLEDGARVFLGVVSVPPAVQKKIGETVWAGHDPSEFRMALLVRAQIIILSEEERRVR